MHLDDFQEAFDTVKENPAAIQLISDQFRNDMDFMVYMVAISVDHIAYASERLKKDLFFYHACFKIAGDDILKYIKKPKIKKKISHLSPDDQSKYIKKLIEDAGSFGYYASKYVNGVLGIDHLNEKAPSNTIHDRKALISLIKKSPSVELDGCVLNMAANHLRDDRQIVILAVDHNLSNFRYASQRLQNDKRLLDWVKTKILKEYLFGMYGEYQYYYDVYHNDHYEKYKVAFQNLPHALKNDPILLFNMSSLSSLSLLNHALILKNQADFVIRLPARALIYTSYRLRTDIHFLLKFTQKYPDHVMDIPAEYLWDRTFIKNAISNNYIVFEYLPDQLKKEYLSHAKEAFLATPSFDKFSLIENSLILQDSKCLLHLVKNSKNIKDVLSFICKENMIFKESENELYELIKYKYIHEIINDFHVYHSITKQLRSDRNFIIELIQKQPNVLFKLPEEDQLDEVLILYALKNDPEIIKNRSFNSDSNSYLNLKMIEIYHEFLDDQKEFNFDEIIKKASLKKKIDLSSISEKEMIELVQKDGMVIKKFPQFNNHPEIAWLAIQNNPSAFGYISESLRDNKDFVLKIKNKSRLGYHIEDISQRLRKDDDIIYEIIRSRPSCLTRMPPKYNQDKDFIYIAIKAFEYATHESIFDNHHPLLKEIDISKYIVQESHYGLTYLHNQINQSVFDDEVFMLSVIEKKSNYISYCSDRLKNDIDFINQAIQRNFQIISNRYRDEILLEKINTLLVDRNWVLNYAQRFKNLSFINRIPAEIMNDPYIIEKLDDFEFIINTIQLKVNIFPYISKRLQDLPELFIFTLEHARELDFDEYKFMEYASDRLKNDRDFILSILKYGCFIFDSIKHFNDDFDIFLIAIDEDPDFLKHASDRLKDDYELVLKAIQGDPRVFQYASDRLKDDYELVLKAMQGDPCVFRYASDRLRDDCELLLKAMQEDIHMFQYASDRLKDDRELLLKVIQKDICLIQYASDRLKDEQEIRSSILTKDIKNLQYLNIFSADIYIIYDLLKHHHDLFYPYEHLSKQLKKCNDPFLILEVIKYSHFKSIPNQFTNHFDFMLEVISYVPEHFKLASKRLRNQRSFIKAAIQKNPQVYNYLPKLYQMDHKLKLLAEQAQKCNDFLIFEKI